MRFHDSWDSLYNHNVKATQIIAADALKHHVKHFIYSSSTEAIGPVTHIPGDETSPYNPTYEYGKTKQLAEQWLKEKQHTAGLPLLSSNQQGFMDRGTSMLHYPPFVRLRTGNYVLPGKGDSVIHFTYVDDVIQGFQRTIEKPQQLLGETFILASDEYITYKKMFTIIANLLEYCFQLALFL